MSVNVVETVSVSPNRAADPLRAAISARAAASSVALIGPRRGWPFIFRRLRLALARPQR
jgi:hypothetical protein